MAPLLSIVIPTFNRAGRLRACLESLGRQTQSSADFEVIVVVDGSTDGTTEMLAGLSCPFALRVAPQENSGCCAARNHGMRLATGAYVLSLDDDMVASPELVSEHLRAQRSGGGAVVIGPCIQNLQPRAGRFARYRAHQRLEHYEALESRPPLFTDCWSGNLSLPRDLLVAVGGFAEDLLRENDTEFALRLHQRGARFVYAPQAAAHEDERESSRDLIADAERRGVVSIELWRRHPPIVSSLGLGGEGELSRPWLTFRRALLPLRVPPRLLNVLGYLVPRRAWGHAWYRFLYSYCYWRGVRRAVPDRDTWRRLVRGTPILMYHAIGRPGERASRFVLPQRRFERQLRWLEARGYDVISLDELVRCRLEHRLPPAKAIVLTFDDGYEDNRLFAAPVLERLGFPATIFLVSRAGPRQAWGSHAGGTGRPMMSLADARELPDGVIALGAHTRTHRNLTALEPAEVEVEVSGSREDLERALGRPVNLFAYPYGGWSPGVREVVMKAGYSAACSVETGRNRLATDPYLLRRIEVRGSDSLVRFALTLLVGDTRHIFRWPR